MGYCCNSYPMYTYEDYDAYGYDTYHTHDDCVCDVVSRIVKAQNEVKDHSCSTSCDRSIQQLRGKGLGPQYTTIPFMLYCSGTCEPFVGSGMFKAPASKKDAPFFGCVESPVFRATQFVKNSDCCVRLEILLPVSDGCEIKPHHTKGGSNIRRFFPEGTPVTNFIASGVCLTVNLKDFAGISCLDPINPIT